MRVTFFRSTAFRLTAIYMVVFVAFSIIMVAYISTNANNRLRVQLNEAIENEIHGLSRQFRRRGIYGLLRHIDRRSREPGSAALLLINHQGLPLAGNIPELPPGYLSHNRDRLHPLPYQRRDVDGELQQHVAMVRLYDLPNGFQLVVGRDIGEREEFKRIIFGFVLFALAAVAVLGFLTWALVGRRVLRRIDAMSATSQSIVAGDLSGRLTVDGSGDEFDRLAENVNGMLDRIEALMIGLKDVSDNIAHDLKTPLTRMRNRVEGALVNESDPVRMREALEGTIVESDQLIRTFDALLKIARVEAGSNFGTDETVNLQRLLDDVVELYEPVAEEAGVTLKIDERSNELVSVVNRELVSQALANLIDNAIKYSAKVEDPIVLVSLKRVADEVVFTISDNGSGVPELDRDKITKRFTRLEPSRSEPGSGLGLSLVNAVAKLHGGCLLFDDNEPGLRALFEIPLKNDVDGEAR